MVDRKKLDWESIKGSELVRKTKKGFFQIILGRSFIISMLILLQLLFLFWLGYVVTNNLFVTVSVSVISLVLIIIIINGRDNMSFHLTWAILIGVFPAFGISLYLMTRFDFRDKLEKEYMKRIIKDSLDYVPVLPDINARLKEENTFLNNIASYTTATGGYRVYGNSDVTYFSVGEDMIDAIEAAIKKAEKFIFMEYFIIYKGEVWERILKALVDRVQQGVEVRLIYDGTMDFSALPHSLPSQLQAVGIQCKMFSPMPVLLTFSYNNRDHRKLAVIDGEAAFTGGVNLADEYANITHPFGHWKDAGVLVRGEGVLGFTLMFLQMWNSMDAEISYYPYLSFPKNSFPEKRGYILPFSDNPYGEERLGKSLYISILSRAESYVYIMTPYLVLDSEMKSALEFAVKRGVDVRILLPHVPDKRYAFALAVSYYEELLRAGIKIYEYEPGFVHSKCWVSDDRRGMVGSINLDYRSLYLNFECGLYMEDMEALLDIKKDFLATIEKSILVSGSRADRIHPVYRHFGRVLRLIAPLF